MATFHLEIITPDRVVLHTHARSVRLPGALGSFGVLPNHAQMAAMLAVGAIRVVHDNGDIEYIASSGGFAEVDSNRVLVLADSAERASDIDVKRVEAAIEHARAQLSEGGAATYAAAQAALKRAVTRLDVAQRREE
jgi:F-type H+-transporting ATPase subunit epsilon